MLMKPRLFRCALPPASQAAAWRWRLGVHAGVGAAVVADAVRQCERVAMTLEDCDLGVGLVREDRLTGRINRSVARSTCPFSRCEPLLI